MGVQKARVGTAPCSASVTSGDDEEYEHNNECRALKSLGRIGEVKWQRSFSMISSGECSESLGSTLSLCSQCQRSSLGEPSPPLLRMVGERILEAEAKKMPRVVC